MNYEQDNNPSINDMDGEKEAENLNYHTEETEFEKVTKERDEYLDGWKRSRAELINYKQEEALRLKELVRFATEDMIRDVISVIDSFDLALTALSKSEDQSVMKGVQMIRVQLEDVLKKRGVLRIICEEGSLFDPTFHEAISVVESDSDSDIIVREVERGYTLNGKIIRPARVVVSKHG